MNRRLKSLVHVPISALLLGLVVGCGDGGIKPSPLDITGTSPDPPFSGTIFIDPDIITSSDPTTFRTLSFAGQGSRTMFDRRVNGWITVDAYLFNASFDDGLAAEIQVNPEFGGSDAALAEAEKYAEVIGRLPTALRIDVETVWIHKGTQPFGGGNNNLLIHIGQADLYAADGILEGDICARGRPHVAGRGSCLCTCLACRPVRRWHVYLHLRTGFPEPRGYRRELPTLSGRPIPIRSDLPVSCKYDIADDAKPDCLFRQSIVGHVSHRVAPGFASSWKAW